VAAQQDSAQWKQDEWQHHRVLCALVLHQKRRLPALFAVEMQILIIKQKKKKRLQLIPSRAMYHKETVHREQCQRYAVVLFSI